MESEAYKELVVHLESKGLKDINNEILNSNKMNKTTFKNPVPYVLNKLNNLYNVEDGNSVNTELLSGKKETNKFAEMVSTTERFKTEKLPGMVDSIVDNNNINWCLMHGEHTDMVFRVPENIIIVLMAPTNRVLMQEIDNYNTFVSLLKNKDFVREYLKNPACLSSQNFCFKYTTILYPGQICFDLDLSGPRVNDKFADSMGYFTLNESGNYKPNGQSSIALSIYLDINEINRVYFIYSCRACNLSLPSKLVEVLYYNEYVCNFINKNKNTCSMKSNTNKMDIQCEKNMFSKMIKSINNNVPKLNFTQINNNNKKIDIVTNLAFTISTISAAPNLNSIEFIDLFSGLESIGKTNEFLKYIIKVGDHAYLKQIGKRLYINLFSDRLLLKWLLFIKRYFFDSNNNIIFKDDIINIYKNTEKYENNLLLRLILGQFIIYYFYTNNIKRIQILTTLFVNLSDNDITFETFITFPRVVVTFPRIVPPEQITELQYILPLRNVFKVPLGAITFIEFTELTQYIAIKKELFVNGTFSSYEENNQKGGSRKRYKLSNRKTKKINSK